jgi:hypothetical protein
MPTSRNRTNNKMKKLGIIANINSLDQIPEGDKINYMKFIIDQIRQTREIVVIDWRDINQNLEIKKHLKCDKERIILQENKSNLNEICDLLFIKNLGKISKEKEKFLTFLKSLNNFKGKTINPLESIKNNLSKQYILDFQENGFSTIPTLDVKYPSTMKELKKLKFKSHKDIPANLVVKPKIFGEQGVGVIKLSDFKNEEEFKEYHKKNHPIIIQPLMEEIKTKGENSFIFIENEFIHSVNKFTGKFKINCNGKTVYTKHKATKEELKLCNKIIEAWQDKINYMRIDLIPHKGKNLISEIETANPAFYIENVLELKDSFIKKLETLFLNFEN